jgi:AAA domain
MPVPLSSLTPEPFLKVLLLGPPKTWKTTIAVTTSPRPVRMILAEDDSALDEARRQGADDYCDLERAMSRDKPYEQMTTFLAQAKADAVAGTIKTVVFDPLSDFADRLLEQSIRLNLTEKGEENGRTAYPHYEKRLKHCLELALTIPCNLIVIAHFIDTSGGEMGAKRVGDGIVPNVPGKARLRIGAKFRDVLWLDLDKEDSSKRVFYTAPTGAWGPGCRSLPGRYQTMPADFSALIKTFESERPGKKAPASPSSAKPMAAKPPTMTNGKPSVVAKPPMKPTTPVRRP